MATRSGKLFRPVEKPQTSLWVLEVDLLSTVLAPYMDLHTLLKARGACKAWAKTWGAYVPGISLEQPLSVAAARSMGSKGAASFPCAVKARITVTSADFTKAALWDAVSAAKALVCQLQLPALRTLHVAWGADFSCSGWVLRQVLPQLPAQQLQVLDLSEAYLLPHLLRLIAAHLTQLQRLVLPDTYMVWNDADLASLAAVSTLRELICHPRPPMSGGQGAGFAALTQLTSLDLSLYLGLDYSVAGAIERAHATAATIEQLAGVSALQRLVVRKATGYCSLTSYDQRRHNSYFANPCPARAAWAKALSGMQQLEAHHSVISDELLAAAAALPALRTLVLDFGDLSGMSCITGATSEALANGPEITIRFTRGCNSCCKALTSLPNLKQFTSWVYHCPDACFTYARVCTCPSCWLPKTHCKAHDGVCCGRCKGLNCSCSAAAAAAPAHAGR